MEIWIYMLIEIRREDKTGSQDLGASSTEEVIKAMVLDNITQGEGAE